MVLLGLPTRCQPQLEGHFTQQKSQTENDGLQKKGAALTVFQTCGFFQGSGMKMGPRKRSRV